MSGKLDQSLDDILTSTRRNNVTKPRRGGRRAASAAHPAPIGGVRKASKQIKGVKSTPTGPANLGAFGGDSRIQVSGLPKDVNEAQIKEYFVKSIGQTKRVEISYGPGGVSRGVATISFAKADAAAKAVGTLNGLLVDGKPMKIDVIVDARRAAAIPAPKGLSERVQPKSQPKSAAVTKASGGVAAGGARGRSARGRGGKVGGRVRQTKKTAEELDSEMADYWESGANGAEATGTAQPAGDATMDDEIL